NMTRRFCENVYGHELGVRLVQNGLVAFALCQAWGNVPEWFADDRVRPPGLRLLQLLDRPQPMLGVYEAASEAIFEIVGVHRAADLAAQSLYRVYHETGASLQVGGMWLNDTSLAWNFTVEGPEHQVIVTDTRTWRAFPIDGQDKHAHLLGEDQMIQQL